MSDAAEQDIAALAKGGRTNVGGFAMRLVARLPFLFIAGRVYGPDLVGRFALAVVVVELAALQAQNNTAKDNPARASGAVDDSRRYRDNVAEYYRRLGATND